MQRILNMAGMNNDYAPALFRKGRAKNWAITRIESVLCDMDWQGSKSLTTVRTRSGLRRLPRGRMERYSRDVLYPKDSGDQRPAPKRFRPDRERRRSGELEDLKRLNTANATRHWRSSSRS